jgi:transposase-like protein
MALPVARGERRGRPRLETKLSSVMRDALRKRRHGTRRGAGISGSVDETDLKVRGRWRYLYRAINRHSSLIDAMLSEQRAMKAAKTVEFHQELTRLNANFPLRIDPRSNLPQTGRRVRSRKTFRMLGIVFGSRHPASPILRR